jgi:hypothetical protein
MNKKFACTAVVKSRRKTVIFGANNDTNVTVAVAILRQGN